MLPALGECVQCAVQGLCNGLVSVRLSVPSSDICRLHQPESGRAADLNRQLPSPRTRDGTGSHFVIQRPSDSRIQRPGDPVDLVTLFYNELQMSTHV